jgi:hypothetical protein
MDFRYYLWVKNIYDWVEIAESRVPYIPNGNRIIRIYVGDPDGEQPREQKGTSYQATNGDWIPFLSIPSPK